MSLDKVYTDTQRAVRGLDAARHDNIDDYMHDAVVNQLEKHRSLNEWMGYIYQCVSRRIGRGREGPMDLPLEESIVPDTKSSNLDLKIDIKKAMDSLTTMQAAYIYGYYFEGYTLEEIAAIHDTTISLVEKGINRGLRKMKKVLLCGQTLDQSSS